LSFGTFYTKQENYTTPGSLHGYGWLCMKITDQV